jgi:hypothetical protein
MHLGRDERARGLRREQELEPRRIARRRERFALPPELLDCGIRVVGNARAANLAVLEIEQRGSAGRG